MGRREQRSCEPSDLEGDHAVPWNGHHFQGRGRALDEGLWAKYEVIALLGEARSYLLDAYTSAKLVYAADKLLEGLEIDLPLLLEGPRSFRRTCRR